ncbi:UNVERIFIED_CONTAM: hypothetical protein FKN15_032766 [Acipenser sinensis]
MQDPKDQAAVDKIMKMLDENKDGQVDFNEYVVLIGALTVACNDFFKDQKKNTVGVQWFTLPPGGLHGKLHKQTTPCRLTHTAQFLTMSQLEGAMAAMISVFHKYSGKEGDKYTLSNGELKDLIKNELGNFLGDPKDQGAVDKIMKMLDENKDGQVDFNEYVVLIGALTVACNDFFKDQKKK